MAGRDIPDVLVEIIRKHLDLRNEIFVGQFRAVCSSWRSSIPAFDQIPPPPHPRDHLFPSRFGIAETTFIPNISVVYHVAPSPHDKDVTERKRGWLIRTDAKRRLLPPLSLWGGCRGSQKPTVVSSVDFGLLEVATPRLLACNYESGYNKMAVSSNLDLFPAVMMVKAGVLYRGNWLDCFNVKENSIGLYPHFPDHTDLSDLRYDDVIFCQGRFCAVSTNGRVGAMDSSFKWKVIASQLPTSISKKNLVESCGELLLVEWHGSNYAKNESYVNSMLRKIKFKVYKLEDSKKQWFEIKASELNDRILFIGNDCSFSVSARDFPGCQGSCIYFSYEVGCGGIEGISSHIGVYHIDGGRASLLEPHANIFRPPP